MLAGSSIHMYLVISFEATGDSLVPQTPHELHDPRISLLTLHFLVCVGEGGRRNLIVSGSHTGAGNDRQTDE